MERKTSKRVECTKFVTSPSNLIKEITLCFYDAMPLIIPHKPIEECTIPGYYILAKTRLMVNVHKFQRDPFALKDHCEFQPKKFLATPKDFDIKGQNPQLIPFSSGQRMYPGVWFSSKLFI